MFSGQPISAKSTVSNTFASILHTIILHIFHKNRTWLDYTLDECIERVELDTIVNFNSFFKKRLSIHSLCLAPNHSPHLYIYLKKIIINK